MTRALRIQYPGAYYHVTCRGNARQNIFGDAKDEKIFLEKLKLSLNIYNISILAYILMTNHFHLVIQTPDGNLSEFMRHFNISYTAAYNKRHNRVGHLYQGRYKAFLIDADNYLQAVSRYIHLNPIRIKSLKNKTFKEKWNILMAYKSSSLPAYLSESKRKGGEFVNYQIVLDSMNGDNRKGRNCYRQFIKNGIEKDISSPLDTGKGHGIVGNSDFIDKIKEKFLDRNCSKREQPALKRLQKTFDPDAVIEQFVEYTGNSRAEICKRGKNDINRSMLMELLYRFCNITQPEIGKLMGGIDYSTVSQARKRFILKMDKDAKLRGMFDKATSHLSRIKI